jgi:hypothetical protein
MNETETLIYRTLATCCRERMEAMKAGGVQFRDPAAAKPLDEAGRTVALVMELSQLLEADKAADSLLAKALRLGQQILEGKFDGTVSARYR